jgi:hypothetical protein
VSENPVRQELVTLNLEDPITRVWAEIYRQGWEQTLTTTEVERFIKEFGRKDKPGWAKKIIMGLAEIVAQKRREQATSGHLHDRTDSVD